MSDQERLWVALRDAKRDAVRHGMIARPEALRPHVAGCCTVPRRHRGGDPMPSPCGDRIMEEVAAGDDPEELYCWCGHTAGCHGRRGGQT